MTLLLATDSAYGSCSVALCQNGTILASAEETTHSRQAERLVPLINTVLHEASITYENLDGLVATIGPGSFTGVRIALAATKGIALATNLPTIGVTTLETVAFQASTHTDTPNILVCMNAMRGEVSCQSFTVQNNEDVTATNEPQMLDYKTLASMSCNDSVTVVGNAQDILKKYAPALHAHTAPDICTPHANDAAELAWVRYGKTLPSMKLEPLYLRKPDAKPQKIEPILPS